MHIDELIRHRKHIHQHPELSGKEQQTSAYIRSFFEENVPSAKLRSVGGTGLLVSFQGIYPKPSIVLRCELDALPIQEINDFDYASTTAGVSHKCGHDGHMSILMAVGAELGHHAPKGTVQLLFQPAEENGNGAPAILHDQNFTEAAHPDYVFALHNIPGIALGEIQSKAGNFTPAVISIELEFHGKVAHAAEPQNGKNPMYTLSEITLQSRRIQKRFTDQGIFCLITPIYCDAGSRNFGIAAGYAKMGFTLRTYSNEDLKELKEAFLQLIVETSEQDELSCTVTWTEAFSSIENDSTCVRFIETAAEHLGYSYHQKKEPFPWGEDFGLFTEKYPGAMFGIGAGKNSPALHNPDYDFPDALIEPAAAMFLTIIKLVQE